MARMFLITLLALSIVCMTPLMGAYGPHHLHHGASVSCATCLGPEVANEVFFLLTLLGMLTVMIPVAPLLALVKNQFHPPRILELSIN